MDTNHYKILECDRNDTLDTIKKNYRRLILKHHPDKNDGNSSTFIQINKAYETITNERQLVSSLNDKARHYLLMLYLMMKPKNIKLKVMVSFKDIYLGITKRINYNRYLKGKKVKDYIYVDLKNFSDGHFIEGYGDENPVTKKCGDLELLLQIDYGEYKNIYVNNIIESYDVSYSVKISLYEYFFGFDKEIEFIDEKIDVKHHIPYQDGMMMNILNKGLPYENDDMKVKRGNLLLLFEIELDNIKKEIIYKDDRFRVFLDEYFR